MVYEIIQKKKYKIRIQGNHVRIGKNQITIGRVLLKIFNKGKTLEEGKYSNGIIYFDKENNKLAIEPTDDYLRGYSFNTSNSFQVPRIIKYYNLNLGTFEGIIKGNMIEIDLNHAL